MLFLRVLVFQLNSGCIIERNPACTGFQLAPAFGRACTLLCFNNGENSFACKLAGCGVIYAGAFKDVAYKSLIKLLVDICKRNGIKKLVWSTNKSERMNHLNGCNMTVHRDYANKSCPGDYLYNLHGQIAKEVNAQLGLGSSKPATSKKTLYRVRKTWKDVKSQKGAFNDLSNAKKCADKNKGYSVFDENGKAVYTSKAANTTGSFKVQISISDLNIRNPVWVIGIGRNLNGNCSVIV